MGRTKPKKKVHSKATDLHLESKKAPSTTSLLAKAQSLIEQCDYDLALRFINRILDQDPKNAEAKEMLGVALLETGELDGAKQVRYKIFQSHFPFLWLRRHSKRYYPQILTLFRHHLRLPIFILLS
jgi:tetratricopeptide (TPR) repeat protein